MAKPTGRITRGTTGVNRLRRVDRWIAAQPAARVPGCLVVDLGYGASATTSLELHERLSRGNPAVEVLGLEIDPARVALATAELEAARAAGPERYGRAIAADARVSFALGGFEVPAPRSPHVIRAMNVLRQYDEHEVAGHWAAMLGRLAPGGLLVEGTSNEVGRVCSWVALDATGPRSLSIALKVDELGSDAMEAPSVVAERLPKALIHRNVPGERVHALLTELDRAWASLAPLADFGATQRWVATVGRMRDTGWPVHGSPARWRLGELTVAWEAVAPRP
ncbi:class I SAM-dependent methyltransferase [Agrococcus sp. TF02-05]|uniref:class I SAM-dependent methyltransferase n=1 Tax=Agrococcus sp. TF02-05 TaxID=2815211 RepID=UPI001AA10420|nr:class I SAM-dependent methyltransferase [Agrococcus sp. TF02-05]MBO1769581.1 class I SAM-dependent methyltransferase [Agrococcus sp. TF02-05]